MYLKEKEQELVDLLTQSNTIVSVKEICKKLFISEPTARRYISALHDKGLVLRTHGGAIINYNTSSNKSVPLYFRISSMSEEKNSIAKQASSLIKDGNVIFLDASSSAFHLLPHLKNFHDITVCTNSLKTAVTLGEMNIKTICLGGDVSSYNLSCNGYETIASIKNFYADLLFFSCDALNEQGMLSDNSKESSYIRREFIKNSKTRVLLLDASKINKQCWHSLCHLSEIDYCFCDSPLPQSLTQLLKAKK